MLLLLVSRGLPLPLPLLLLLLLLLLLMLMLMLRLSLLTQQPHVLLLRLPLLAFLRVVEREGRQAGGWFILPSTCGPCPG
jgi:hypothetical protein